LAITWCSWQIKRRKKWLTSVDIVEKVKVEGHSGKNKGVENWDKVTRHYLSSAFSWGWLLHSTAFLRHNYAIQHENLVNKQRDKAIIGQWQWKVNINGE
jgi:hypothetical protein